MPDRSTSDQGDAERAVTITDERQLVAKFRRWWKNSDDTFATWRTDSIESQEFVSGEQWSAADLAARKMRPCLVINKILGPVLFLMGMQREQREEPKILPFEGSDVRPAELMSALYKWVGTRSQEPVIDSRVFTDKIITGIGYWKVGVDFDESSEGEVRWQHVSPLAIFPDPNFLDSGWDAAKYVIHATWWDLDEAMERWPESADSIERQYGEWLSGAGAGSVSITGGGESAGDTLASDRSFWDKDTQRLRVLEVWYKQRKQTVVALDPQGQEVESDPEKVGMLMQQAMMGQVQDISLVERSVTEIRVAHMLNETLLDDGESPYNEPKFPIFPTIGFYFSTKKPFGVVKPMKDPQREKNKRRSVLVEMVQRSSLSGFQTRREGGPRVTDLNAYASGSGVVIPYDTEPALQINPPELPQTLVFLDSRSDQEIRDVVNINNELMGSSTQRTVSGRAIQARQRSGLIVQEPLLESFTQDKEPAVRFAISLIQQFMSAPTALRILGTMVARHPTMPAAGVMQASPQDEIQQLLSTAFSDKFDVVVGSKAWEPSLQVQRWNALTELVEKFPGAIPPDVLVEAAKDAGLLTEEQAQKTLLHIQQQQMLQQAMQAQQAGMGGGPGGPPPGPPG